MGPLRFLSAGESHGPTLSAILQGVPAGFYIDQGLIQQDLKRRQQGFGRSARMKMETDRLEILSGLHEGYTTGAPVCFLIHNQDYDNWKDKPTPQVYIPRPGHADLAGSVKYNHANLQLTMERSSARETAMRVCMGSFCKQLLSPFDIEIGGYVYAIGPVGGEEPKRQNYLEETLKNYIQCAKNNEMAFYDEQYVEGAKSHIREVMKAKDTVGGIVEVAALGVPVGLGSYTQWDERLDALLTQALMSIPAVKGVEIGQAFLNTKIVGSQVHDPILLKNGKIDRGSNHAGGLEGGVSNGQPIVARLAMKPINTLLKGIESVHLQTKEPCLTPYIRSDFCAVTRLVPIAESMMAFVMANAFFKKRGGDSLKEMKALREPL